MRVKMLCPVTVIGGADEDNPHTNDVTYEREAVYEVNDTLGESLIASGQAVTVEDEDSEIVGFVNPLPNTKATTPPENK